jgi:hypothetical protein
MVSKGQRLYEVYAESMLQAMNCEVDPWESLAANEQNVWEMAAEALLQEFAT